MCFIYLISVKSDALRLSSLKEKCTRCFTTEYTEIHREIQQTWSDSFSSVLPVSSVVNKQDHGDVYCIGEWQGMGVNRAS